MKRRLRIAVSVIFTLVAVALAVLCVRSYRVCDYITVRVSYIYFNAGCTGGKLGVKVLDRGVQTPPYSIEFNSNSLSLNDPRAQNQRSTFMGFVVKPRIFLVPFWLPIMLMALSSALPLSPISKRFSLRTLLIATTLVAVVLGLIVWVAH